MELYYHSLCPATSIVVLLGIFAFALAAERMVALSKATRHTGEISRRLAEMIRKGQLNLAEYTCSRFDTPVARTINAGIRVAGCGLSDIRESMKRVAAAEIRYINRGLGTLESLCLLAPLTGLAGTLYAWKTVSDLSATITSTDFSGLANQFSIAIESSIAGITTAIICGIFVLLLNHRAEYVASVLNKVVEELSPAIDRAGRGETSSFAVATTSAAVAAPKDSGPDADSATSDTDSASGDESNSATPGPDSASGDESDNDSPDADSADVDDEIEPSYDDDNDAEQATDASDRTDSTQSDSTDSRNGETGSGTGVKQRSNNNSGNSDENGSKSRNLRRRPRRFKGRRPKD